MSELNAITSSLGKTLGIPQAVVAWPDSCVRMFKLARSVSTRAYAYVHMSIKVFVAPSVKEAIQQQEYIRWQSHLQE